MPKVVSELGVEDWLHVELSLNQLNSYKHLIVVYLLTLCPLQAPDKRLVPCPAVVNIC